jgi:hypothetical protein
MMASQIYSKSMKELKHHVAHLLMKKVETIGGLHQQGDGAHRREQSYAVHIPGALCRCEEDPVYNRRTTTAVVGLSYTPSTCCSRVDCWTPSPTRMGRKRGNESFLASTLFVGAQERLRWGPGFRHRTCLPVGNGCTNTSIRLLFQQKKKRILSWVAHMKRSLPVPF